MKALVVYESMWGNTAQIAQAIATGLSDSASVEVLEMSIAPASPAYNVDLVVVGGPTHTFSMSRPDTRYEAVKLGASNTTPSPGIREWIAELPSTHAGVLVATFDTRVAKTRRLPGSAARKAGKLLSHLGYEAVVAPEGFFVAGVEGPLVEGEFERARSWGAQLAASARQTLEARATK
ncbi:flavodoxin family protein [Demequina aurantiaca]|uniref:flavodoxin family protein n=1 Tax=Demequina aurantiaca TaxID=676200 RepID=UPI003D33DF39